MPFGSEPVDLSIKRVFDVIFSLCVISLGWPLLLCLSFAIKISSKGPVFYASKRVGRNGKEIICWKLRTMRCDADIILQTLLNEDPALKEEWMQKYKLKEDIRITKIGSFLRKTFLDELPQFWNVLKGDLSIVGPRPVTKEEFQLFIEQGASEVFSVRPGLTGLWQTSERGELTYSERIEMERQYVTKQSFTLDLFLIAKTIPCIMSSKGDF